MKPKEWIARGPVTVLGKDYRPGDTFDADEKDIRPQDKRYYEKAPQEDPAMREAADRVREADKAADVARRKALRAGATGKAED